MQHICSFIFELLILYCSLYTIWLQYLDGWKETVGSGRPCAGGRSTTFMFMKNWYVFLLLMWSAIPSLSGQVTILDFEAPGTSTNFQYFGSSLDGSLTEVITNPNPSGINTSSKVTKFIKPAGAQVWAGAFSNPAPAVAIDLTNGGPICVKVHMDHIGNLALKLEGSTSGQPNWIQVVSNTKINEWEELCFDINLPSLEAPNTPASGVYGVAVLFFDFGTPGGATDVTSYVDDIVVKGGGGGPAIRTVNFQVDMNSYTANFNQVYLSGNFNGWSGESNPLADPDFDGIWTGSLELPVGSYEYKVSLDNWSAQEQFGGAEECTVTDPSGQFTNRKLVVSSNMDVPRFCFNSCYACGEEVTIQFRLGMGGVVPNADGVWLSGGGNFDVPGGKYRMSDDDLDGVYEISVPRKRGFSSYYAFANGPCFDFSCKENLAGQPCGDPANFNDRWLPAVQNDTIVATCYGACFTNTTCTSGSREEQLDASIFSLLSNPSVNGYSVLHFGTEVAEAEKRVILTNLLGATVREWEVAVGTADFQLPTAELQSGAYFVTVQVGAKSFTRTLLK